MISDQTEIPVLFSDRQIAVLSRLIGRQVAFHPVEGRLFLDHCGCDAKGLSIQHWEPREKRRPIRGDNFIYLGTRHFRPAAGQPELGLRVPVVLSRLPSVVRRLNYEWTTFGRSEPRHTTLEYVGDFKLFPSSGFRLVRRIEIYTDRVVSALDPDRVEYTAEIDQRICFSFNAGPELVIELGHWSDPSFLFLKPTDERPYTRSSDTLLKRVVIDRALN